MSPTKTADIRNRLANGETVAIGKVLAGTVISPAMIDDMWEAMMRGEAIHTYFDGHAVRVERIDIRKP